MGSTIEGPFALATFSNQAGTTPQTSFNDANGLVCYTGPVNCLYAAAVLFEVLDSVGSKAPTAVVASGRARSDQTSFKDDDNFCGIKPQGGTTGNFWTIASPARIWVIPQLVTLVMPPPMIHQLQVRLVITTAAGAASFTPTVRAWVMRESVIASPAPS